MNMPKYSSLSKDIQKIYERIFDTIVSPEEEEYGLLRTYITPTETFSVATSGLSREGFLNFLGIKNVDNITAEERQNLITTVIYPKFYR